MIKNKQQQQQQGKTAAFIIPLLCYMLEVPPEFIERLLLLIN